MSEPRDERLLRVSHPLEIPNQLLGPLDLVVLLEFCQAVTCGPVKQLVC